MTETKRKETPNLRAAIRKGRGLLVWAFVFSVLVNLLMLTGPLYMLAVYDQVLASGSVEMLTALTLLVLALFGLMGVLDYVRGRVMSRFGARFQTDLDQPLFSRLVSLAQTRAPGEANTVMIRHLDALQSMFLSPALIAVMDMPWAPLFIAAIFFLHPALGWLAVCGGVIIVALTVINQRTSERGSRDAQRQSHMSHQFVSDAFEAHEIVRGQAMRDSLSRRYAKMRLAAQQQHLNASDWMGLFASSTKAFRMFLQSAILGLGAFYVIKGQLTPGAMIACSILLGRALAPIELAMSNWTGLQRARAGWIALERFLNETAQTETISPGFPSKAHLRVTDLAVIPPGASVPTIRGVSFDLHSGQVLGVIGPSGSGKSSLARCLSGVWSPTAGELYIGDVELHHAHWDTLGNIAGYLPQSVRFLSGTVAENIRQMSVEPDRTGVVSAAKRARAHKMIMGLPNGYDTHLAGSEAALSGGQRQRIALARAIYGTPDLLILDEPNSMLDAEGTEALNSTIREMKASGTSVILMTHRPHAISECDLLMVLENGRMTACGPRREVIEKSFPNVAKIRDLAARKVLK